MKIKSIEWKTNKIRFEEKDGKKLVVKKFDSIKPILLLSLYNLAHFFDSLGKSNLKDGFYFPSVKNRIENEIKAREVLSKFGFKFPRIYWFDENSICMEKLNGEILSNFYRNVRAKVIYKISKRIGERVRKIHDSGYSFLDCRSENYMVKDGEIFNLDLEFFTEATEFRKMCDVITYDTSILSLEPEKCESAIKGFHSGYKESLTSNEVFYIIIFSCLYPFSLKENLNELTNRRKNIRKLMGEYRNLT
jgi:tRNA A-37 threonylcarbamoyl transferase component Bud32